MKYAVEMRSGKPSHPKLIGRRVIHTDSMVIA
jgi:hypothetical protein